MVNSKKIFVALLGCLVAIGNSAQHFWKRIHLTQATKLVELYLEKKDPWEGRYL